MKNKRQFRNLIAIVTMIVVTSFTTSCSKTYEDINTKSAQLTIDGIEYNIDSGISNSEKKIKGKLYNNVTVNVDIFFEMNLKKDEYAIGDVIKLDDTNKIAISVIAFTESRDLGLEALRGDVIVVSENEIQLKDCIYEQSSDKREVEVSGTIKF